MPKLFFFKVYLFKKIFIALSVPSPYPSKVHSYLSCYSLTYLITQLKFKKMKKIFFVAASASFFLIACNNGATNGTSSANDSTIEKNLVKNRKVYKAVETGDRAVLDSSISSDAVDHSGPNGTTISNGDSVKNMLADMHNHIKDLNINIITAAANDDYIFTYSELTGTAADSTWGMPAGTKLDEKGVDLVKVKDGKMVEHWAFADPNEMMKHMQEMNNNKMNMTKGK